MTAAVIGGVERRLGAWKPSPRKLRGIKPTVDLAALPMTMTIEGFPTDYDQGQLGSCGPNSLAEMYQFDDPQHARYSRLFAYWFTRATEGDFLHDDGVTIPDLLDIAHTMGLPLETTWPYDLSQYQVPPPLGALVEAVRHRVERQDVVVDLDHLLFELAHRQPVMFGFLVPASMQSAECARTGLVKVPSSSDPALGGHCVNAIGYSRSERLIRATCHYGSDFGDHGTILLPFEHFTTGNATDMRAVRSIS